MTAGVSWWRGAAGYEVYLPSFQDSNGDGGGDVDGRGRHLAFFFGLVESAWEPPRVGRMLADAVAASPNLSRVHSSHDRPREVTRYGGGPRGWRRWLALFRQPPSPKGTEHG